MIIPIPVCPVVPGCPSSVFSVCGPWGHRLHQVSWRLRTTPSMLEIEKNGPVMCGNMMNGARKKRPKPEVGFTPRGPRNQNTSNLGLTLAPTGTLSITTSKCPRFACSFAHCSDCSGGSAPLSARQLAVARTFSKTDTICTKHFQRSWPGCIANQTMIATR